MLVKERIVHQVNRPLGHCITSYLLGIIIGNILHQKLYVSFNIGLIIIFIGLILYKRYYTVEAMSSVLFCMILGIICYMNCSLHQEETYFKKDKQYLLNGQISQINQSSYYQWVTLSHVQECETGKCFKNKIRVRLPLSINSLSSYDKITIEAQVIDSVPRMNPSDFDYTQYLKSEKIIVTLKADKLVTYENPLEDRFFLDYKEQTPFLEKIQSILRHQLEKLFRDNTGQLNHHIGIIEACLLGDDSRLEEQTENFYQQAGISHVLCISGFHVGVVISVIMSIMIAFSYVCFIPYTLRQILLIVALWGYTLFTGSAVSTLRATQMMTVTLIGKCLWQEDDALTNLAIAAFIIVFLNPYQLFRVGFQLSFSAMLGIICYQTQLEKKEIQEMKVYTSIQKSGLIWFHIQLFTLPILAYHFYSVPFSLSLLNMMIIPLFAVIIIMSWCSVGLSFIIFPIAKLGIECVIEILTFIEKGISIVETYLPFATICVGKPTLLKGSLYIVSAILISYILWGYWKPKKLYLAGTLIGCCYLAYSFYQMIYPDEILKITSLYVGQGDCTVIEMPKYGLFIVDGGNFGKGDTLESYIYYLGYDKVEGIMISHCDDDHIGGILELLDTNIRIKRIFLAKDNQNKNFESLLNKCQEKKVAVHYLEKGDSIKYDKVLIECFAPSNHQSYSNSNDKSLLCQLSYNTFTMLFTGDKSIKSDKEVYDMISGPITLLKVSHHGSRTGTSSEILSKLQPQYATISCGIQNRYNHPHQEVIALLEDSNTKLNRTDQDGAILYETDGYTLIKKPFRKES